jgi:hypothetical protein
MRFTSTLAAIALTTAAAAAAAAPPALAAGDEQLPDLDQEAPAGLVVTHYGRAGFALGFDSAVRNIGPGALHITGHRPGRDTRMMVADQLVDRAGAPSRRVRHVGRLRYVVSPDHRHWHLLGFDRYTLRRVGGGTPVRRDRKSGFCLGDRYAVEDATAPGPGGPPRFTSRCGLGQPGRLHVREGISTGYGDDYGATLEGQYVTLQGLPAGRYQLVHRVNADRRLRETRYDNDAASALLSLRWKGGKPYLRVIATCSDTARCGAADASLATLTSPDGGRVPLGHRGGGGGCCCCAEPPRP